MAHAIPFIQYMRPDGRRNEVYITRPKEIYEMAKKVMRAGLRFECEVLTTGDVSFTVFDPEEEDDVDIEVCFNGPDVHAAVDRLVNRAFRRLAA